MGLRDLLCCIRKPAPERERSHFSEEEAKKPISSRKPTSEGERSHFNEEEMKKPISSRKLMQPVPANGQADRSHFSEEELKKPLNSPPPVIRKPMPPEHVQGERSHFNEEEVKMPISSRKPAPEEAAVKNPLNSPPSVIRKPAPPEHVQGERSHFNEEEVKKPISSRKPASEGNRSHFSEEEVKKPIFSEEKVKDPILFPARELSITWGDDKRYWQWMLSGAQVEVAELLEVCWFDVQGKFETRKLSLGTTYQVFFLVMLKKGASGFEDPVNLRLVLPDGQKLESKVSLMNLKKDEWIELQVGEFYMSNKVGQIQFFMFEHSNKWKRGLVVKGVVIRPKT